MVFLSLTLKISSLYCSSCQLKDQVTQLPLSGKYINNKKVLKKDFNLLVGIYVNRYVNLVIWVEFAKIHTDGVFTV